MNTADTTAVPLLRAIAENLPAFPFPVDFFVNRFIIFMLPPIPDLSDTVEENKMKSTGKLLQRCIWNGQNPVNAG